MEDGGSPRTTGPYAVKFDVRIAGKTRVVELERDGDRWRIALDGVPAEADAMEVAPNIFSLLIAGEAHEVRVATTPGGGLKLQAGNHEFDAEVADPRAWRGRRHGAIEAEGRQAIVAPMPGKVIRLLVKAGDKVQTGQG